MIYELFSQRKKRLEKSGQEDVYQYNDASVKLRVQVQQIFMDAIGPHYPVGPYDMHSPHHNPKAWTFIANTLYRENGIYTLADGSTEGTQVINYLASANIDQFLDAVELCMRYIDKILSPYNEYQRKEHSIKQTASEAISEVNFRMRESGLGFQYEGGQLVKADSEYTHEEIIKPALSLLSKTGFSGPQAEFMQAHSHYRAGEYSQAIVEAAKSFESMLKAVCDQKGWSYDRGARASDLLKRVRQENLWPTYLDASFDQLLATLSSGLPKVRNEEGAHGQGAVIRTIPEYVASYALHLAAAKIRLISEAAST